jgi:hypothetical protein
MLKTTTNKLGYVQVGLKKHGENKLKLVHRVVAEAFFLLRLVEVNHIDGVKSNNCLSNLEWSTRKLNSLHSTQVLMKNRGEDNNRAKLTEKEVLSIKQNLEDGFSQTEVARRYSVTNHAVFRIQHGYNWAWLTGYEKKGGSYVALN